MIICMLLCANIDFNLTIFLVRSTILKIQSRNSIIPTSTPEHRTCTVLMCIYFSTQATLLGTVFTGIFFRPEDHVLDIIILWESLLHKYMKLDRFGMGIQWYSNVCLAMITPCDYSVSVIIWVIFDYSTSGICKNKSVSSGAVGFSLYDRDHLNIPALF